MLIGTEGSNKINGFYTLAMESRDIVVRLSGDVFDCAAIIKFLDYLELESIRQRSQMSETQAYTLADKVDRGGWQSLKESLESIMAQEQIVVIELTEKGFTQFFDPSVVESFVQGIPERTYPTQASKPHGIATIGRYFGSQRLKRRGMLRAFSGRWKTSLA